MPRVLFTTNLKRHVDCPPADVAGTTVAQALDAYFQKHATVRDYVLDERGAMRKHMTIFVGGEPLHDRQKLSDPVAPSTEVWVMQALSGG